MSGEGVMPLEHGDDGLAMAPDPEQRLERTHGHAMAAMRLDLGWACENARHLDSLVVPRINLWRDLFPPEIEVDLLDRPAGHVASHAFEAGEMISAYRDADCLRIEQKAFNRRFRRHGHVEPRAGRFYPKGMIAGVRDIFPENPSPFRVGEVGEQLTVDLNPPLAGRAVRLSVQILDIWAGREEHGGACNEVAVLATAEGPGMQARWRNRETDFWSDAPFSRLAPGPDADFYAQARLVDHLDRVATEQVERLYARLIPRGSRVLDLMGSWKSHLPPAIAPSGVTGLGMNAEELERNPVLGERVVRDLNERPALPFDDASFDAVVCTVSIEYLTRPLEVFAEVARVLGPGGRFVLTFSNRWFQPKVVRVWEDIHELERPGLVLEYFLRAGGFGDLETWSLRGLPRPGDDPYAAQQPRSDPVYGVWGTRR